MEKMMEQLIATCSVCGNDFDEVDINMMDYELDLCAKCERKYKKSKRSIQSHSGNGNVKYVTGKVTIYKLPLRLSF